MSSDDAPKAKQFKGDKRNGTVWIFDHTLRELPAMNEYSAPLKTAIGGYAFYVLVWLLTFLFINASTCESTYGCWIEPLIGFTVGSILIYLEYFLDTAQTFYFLFPDRSMYSTLSPDQVGQHYTYDYAVVTESKKLKFDDPHVNGYIMSDRAYEKALDSGEMKATMLDQYLKGRQRAETGEEFRKQNTHQVVNSFGLEMEGLSASAYFISMTMITWGSYVIMTKWGGMRTLLFTVLAVLVAVISTAILLVPTNMVEASKLVFARQTGVHMATSFAVAALAAGFIES